MADPYNKLQSLQQRKREMQEYARQNPEGFSMLAQYRKFGTTLYSGGIDMDIQRAQLGVTRQESQYAQASAVVRGAVDLAQGAAQGRDLEAAAKSAKVAEEAEVEAANQPQQAGDFAPRADGQLDTRKRPKVVPGLSVRI